MRILLAGQIGREAAIAQRLANEGNEIHIIGEFENPSLGAITEEHGGSFYPISNLMRIQKVGDLAQAANPDLVWINNDDMLAKGVIDILRQRLPKTLLASPDRRSSQIEWDKVFSRRIIDEIDQVWGTNYNPDFMLVGNQTELHAAIDYFSAEDKDIVIKPQGLTGGKGVKVMGIHCDNYDEASQYASQILRGYKNNECVLIEERLEGYEFTVQGITDGWTLIKPPTTYDYPYREDGDTGPGTGGMGSFTMAAGEQLPFLTPEIYDEALQLMQEVLNKLGNQALDFKGVLYGSFFMTPQGLKVVEFNARGGDPEMENIIELLDDDVSLTTVLKQIAKHDLRAEEVRFRKLASTVIYLVAPDYAYPVEEAASKRHEFNLNARVIADHDCRIYFAGAEQIGLDRYRTVGSSRTVALASLAPTPWEARAKILAAIEAGVSEPLQFRQDIGDEAYIKRLRFMEQP